MSSEAFTLQIVIVGTLYFFSILPFSRNKETGWQLSFAVCWCTVDEAREVVIPAQKKKQFNFTCSDMFSKIIMLKCQHIIHSTVQQEKEEKNTIQ